MHLRHDSREHGTRGRRRRALVLLPLILALLVSTCRAAPDASPAGEERAAGAPAAATGPPAPGSPSRSGAPAVSPLVVFLDPGHGGPEFGTAGVTLDGTLLLEKDVTLAIALRTAARLRAAGITVVLSRTSDELPGLTAADRAPGGQGLTPEGVLRDLQRRVDRANASGASLLLSIHLNSFVDPSAGGTETYYDASRPFAASSRRLARLVQREVVEALHAVDYPAQDRGVFTEAELHTPGLGVLPAYRHLVLLGPEVPGRLRPSGMPGVLNEVLFLSNPAEASAVQRPEVQDAIAGAYTRAILEYLAQPGSWTESRTQR